MIVAIERISQSDKASLRQWRNDPEVTRWGYSNHVISEEEHNAWFDNMLVDASKVYWKIVVDGIAVGATFLTGISDQGSTCEWGMYLADVAVRGKGVSQAACALLFRYALNDLGMKMVRCDVFAQNDASIRMCESVGHMRSGVQADAVKRGDEMLSVVTLELTRESWSMREPQILLKLRERGVNIDG